MAAPVFDLKNIFVVFGPGAGGNFVAGLLDKLIRNDFSNLTFASTGSSHTLLTKKHLGGDSLSFGTISEEHYPFKSQEEREQYYLTKINDEYSDVTTPQIVWTHDYSNIPIYKKYFKNCRILTIIHDSYLSRLTSIFMHSTKMFLDPNPNNIWPMEEFWATRIKRRRDNRVKEEIAVYLGHSLSEEIFNKRNTEQYAKDIVTYFTHKWLIESLGMLGFVEGTDSGELCLYDFALYPNPAAEKLDIGDHYYDYVTESDATLTYSYLISDKPDLLVRSIEKIIQKPLTVREKDFVMAEYTRYRRTQNKDILRDPIYYYQTIKEIATSHIEKIITNNTKISV